MSYRPHPEPTPLLFGYDPVRDLPQDHLARLVESVVEETIRPMVRPKGPGAPPFDPRVCVKVLVYGYATGIRSSRQLERSSQESLPYLFLCRGDAPSYRTLCTARIEQKDLIEQVWVGLFAVASRVGIERMGKITIDSTKFRANASSEAVLKQKEYGAVLQELEQILAEAQEVDQKEEMQRAVSGTRLGKTVVRHQMRDILRRVR